MKKLLFLFCSFLIFLPRVNATNGAIGGSIRTSEIYQSGQAQFYHSSHSSLSTSFNSSPGYSSYYQTTLSSDRGFLSFNVNHALLTDTLYTLTVYIGNNGNNPIGNPGYNISTGSGVTDANSNNSSGNSRVTVWNFTDTWNILTGIEVDNSVVSPREAQTGMYFITFTTSTDGDAFLNIPLYFGNSVTQVYYYGYNLQVVGRVDGLNRNDIQSVINSSGLATASSVQQVQQGVNELKQDINDLNNSVDKVDDTLNDTDISGAQDSADSFFENFDTDDYGLSDIITMPLTLINSLLNTTCAQLTLNIPFVDKTLNLPCMSEIYEDYFGSFFDLYQLVTFGFVAYWVCVRIFNLVKDFKNPEHDEIEVMDL